MPIIRCGPATASFEMTDDGIAKGAMTGLLSPGNAGPLSGLMLEAGAAKGARGVLCSVERSLVALPQIDPQHYAYIPDALRGLPVAIVMSAEQAVVYERVTAAASMSGAMRRAFLWPGEAEAWLREHALALTANHVWWSRRR